MGKGFLDPPLYQAHIQVVLSLNLKLFIKFRAFNFNILLEYSLTC